MGEAIGPLHGRRVVITRPVEHAPALAELLEAEGAVPVVVPLIELVPVASDADVAAAVAGLAAGDWVIATSVEAARRIAPHVASSSARVAAVGATTARWLPRVDLVPEQQDAAGLVRVVPTGTGRVLVVQAEEGAPTLVEGLTARGWSVRRLVTHRSRPVEPTAAQQQAVLSADALVFTSGTQAGAWVDIFGISTPPTVVTIGPQTTMKTQDFGIKVQATAADHSLAGILAALQDCFRADGS